MSLSLIAIQTWTLVAVILGPGSAPSPTDSTTAAGQPARRSPFDSGPVKDPADPVERLYHRALRFKTEAMFLGRNPAGRHYLDISDMILERVVTLQPDHGAAHQLLGETCFYRTPSAPDQETRLNLVTAGNEHFGRAEKCPGVDWTLYRNWGQGLAMLAYQYISDSTARRRLMRQAVDIVERGVHRKDLAEHRGDLLQSVGLATAILAENQEDPIERTHWYRQTIKSYKEAQEIGELLDLFHRSALAEALFRLGDLVDDPDLTRQSVKCSKQILEENANDVAAHYNLACAYSVLGEHRLAIGHLETCATFSRAFLKRAAADPAMRQLRASSEYALFLEMIKKPRDAKE